MCGSRKYPYPTTGGISLSTPPPPPPPWIFHIYKELVTSDAFGRSKTWFRNSKMIYQISK